MKTLVTGVGGFVGRHLLDRLERSGDAVYGLTRSGEGDARLVQVFASDLGSVDEIVDVLERVRPDRVVHLASRSSVGQSWHDPVASFVENTTGFLHLIEAVRRCERPGERPCRVLSVGSSEQYGNVDPTALPILETQARNPESPYAIARDAQELLARMYHRSFGLDVVMTRSFNHIGPGQDRRFVVPSFVARLAALAERPAGDRVVSTGDVTLARDFLDVRDVVRAYELLLDQGMAGEAYNVCSGTSTRLSTLLSTCAGIVGVELEQRTDPTLVRPNEAPVIEGSFEKLQAATGWTPSIALVDTLADIVDDVAPGARTGRPGVSRQSRTDVSSSDRHPIPKEKERHV